MRDLPTTTPAKGIISRRLSREEEPVARGCVEAIEESRHGIAQELHDTVCQSLSGVRLSAAALRRKTAGMSEPLAADLARLEDTAAKAVADLHEIIRSLQPVEVPPGELPVALDALIRDTRPKAKCEFRCVGTPVVADAFAAEQALRIAQMAVQQATRSGRVANFVIEWREAAGESLLVVAAEAPVFADREGDRAQQLAWRLSLRRAEAAGGSLTIEDGGAVLVLRLPA